MISLVFYHRCLWYLTPNYRFYEKRFCTLDINKKGPDKMRTKNQIDYVNKTKLFYTNRIVIIGDLLDTCICEFYFQVHSNRSFVLLSQTNT